MSNPALSKTFRIVGLALLSLSLCQTVLAEKSASENTVRTTATVTETAAAEPTPSALETSAPSEPAATVKQSPKATPSENFIVQASSMDVALKAVEGVGGKVTHRLGIIDAVAADLTSKQLETLKEIGGVRLHANRRVQIEK